MVKGIGLDIMLIERMRESIRRELFLERVFTDNERLYLQGKGDEAESAAGIFAAKEAVMKALGWGIGDIPLRSIEIVHDMGGAPQVHTNFPEDKHVAGKFHVSITHMGEMAAAVAVWEV